MTLTGVSWDVEVLPDIDAEVPCKFAGCAQAAVWQGRYSKCGCHSTFCDHHRSWWDSVVLGNARLYCESHDVSDQRFVDWRRL